MFCQFNQLVEKGTLEVTLINYFIDQVFSKVLTVLKVCITFNDFRNEKSSLNLLIKHIQEEVKFWQQKLLTLLILITTAIKEVNAVLEQVSVLNFLENKLF